MRKLAGWGFAPPTPPALEAWVRITGVDRRFFLFFSLSRGEHLDDSVTPRPVKADNYSSQSLLSFAFRDLQAWKARKEGAPRSQQILKSIGEQPMRTAERDP